jgi:hypothetical protein
MRIVDAATTGFNRLILGLATTSFPSIKRNGSGIDIRNAADTAFTALRAADITASGVVGATSFAFSPSGSRISSSENGIVALTNNSGNDFSRLQFGGITPSYPSIKRNGNGIDIRDASDIQFADLRAANISGNTGYFNTIYALSTADNPANGIASLYTSGGVVIGGGLYSAGDIYSESSVGAQNLNTEGLTITDYSPTIPEFNCVSFVNKTRVYSPANGVIQFTNNARNGFDRLQLGGPISGSSSFPSIKRNGSGIDIRNAVDTQFTPLAASNITANGSIYATSGIYATGTIVTNDDIEVSDFAKGVILKSEDGSRFRITVNNSGALTTTQL